MHKAENLTIFICRLSRNGGARASWNLQGLSVFFHVHAKFSKSYPFWSTTKTRCSEATSIRWSDLLGVVAATEYLLSDRMGLQPISAHTLSVFCGFRTVLTAPENFIYLRSRFSKLLYPFRDGAAIRIHSVCPNVKMSSEYLVR